MSQVGWAQSHKGVSSNITTLLLRILNNSNSDSGRT